MSGNYVNSTSNDQNIIIEEKNVQGCKKIFDAKRLSKLPDVSQWVVLISLFLLDTCCIEFKAAYYRAYSHNCNHTITKAFSNQVLREIENVYFLPPSEFDAGRFVLEHAPATSCDDIERMFTKLKRQQQASICIRNACFFFRFISLHVQESSIFSQDFLSFIIRCVCHCYCCARLSVAFCP